MMAEFRDFAYEEYRSGRWGSAGRQPTFTFPDPFGPRKAAAMGLAEMHQLTRALPGLRDDGLLRRRVQPGRRLRGHPAGDGRDADRP